MTPSNEPAAPGITTLGKFANADPSKIRVLHIEGSGIDDENMKQCVNSVCSIIENAPPIDPLMELVTDGISTSPSDYLRAARDWSRLEERQRESTILLGAITRGQHAWYLAQTCGVPFAQIDPDRRASDIAREVRVYLGHRSGMLEGCDTLTRAEIRLGIRDSSSTLKQEWL